MDDGAEPRRKPVKRSGKKKKNTDENFENDPTDNIIKADSMKKSTKATFDLYLEQAQAAVERDRKSPKKNKNRKKKEEEEVLLENLKNSSEFKKDKDHETEKRNTYDPDDSKSKSNKKKERAKEIRRQEDAENFGQSNSGYEPDMRDEPMTISELQTNSHSKGKNTSKLKNKAKQEEETSFMEGDENLIKASKEKPKKSKKAGLNTSLPEEQEQQEANKLEDDGKIVEVIVHRADKLRTNFLIQHPLVRIHIVDEDTGKHVTKFKRDRAVTSFYETMNRDNVPSQILPVMTQMYDFKKMRSIIPWWDENVVFNECFNYLIQAQPKVIIFFEVLDFVSMNKASKNQQLTNTIKGEEGWHKEAWAFLKLRGANNNLNVNKQLRLQLYEIPRTKVSADQVPVYQYWRNCVRRPYPSTLYVTINSIVPPDSIPPGTRSVFPTQEEKGSKTLKQLQETLLSTRKKEFEETRPSLWTRLRGQTCRLPNKPMLTLSGGKMGCLVIKFSNDGRFLACSCHDRASYPMKIYSIPEGELKTTLSGHHNTVYDLEWSKTDSHVLTASSDGTARLWNIQSRDCEKMMSHPTFVYSAKFNPKNNQYVFTGSYDTVIRVWDTDGLDKHASLLQELEGHQVFVNSLCFDLEGAKLFSADGSGVIKVWEEYDSEQSGRRGERKDWKFSQEIVNEELKDQSISYIALHPNGRRLLVHTKDSNIRMLDLRMMAITQRYIGAHNFKQIIRSDVTPCGTFVYSGSEDGRVYVWNTETGDQVADYPELGFLNAVNDVKFHPFDHIVAFCSRGDNHKILVFKYEANIMDSEALKFVHQRPKLVKTADHTDEALLEEKMDDISLVTKKQRAMKKLASVMAISSVNRVDMPTESSTTPGLMSEAAFALPGTWNSTYEAMLAYHANSLGPTIMSPHAQLPADSEALKDHLISQMEYIRTSPTPGWRPTFSPIGTRREVTPTMNLTVPTISNPKGCFNVIGADELKPMGEVKALYDYQAQRSDELTFCSGDIITILYKDSVQWWMGRHNSTGQEGYFPANYVEDLSYDSASEVDVPGRTTTTAIIDKGQLKFISGTESDGSLVGDQQTRTRTFRRRKQRSRATLGDRRSSSRERRRNKLSNPNSGL